MRVLIAYSFAGEESDIAAPNFYKSCGEKVFPVYSVEVNFLPNLRRHPLFVGLSFLGFKPSAALLACSAWWLARHGKRFDLIVGWLGNGVLAAVLRKFLG